MSVAFVEVAAVINAKHLLRQAYQLAEEGSTDKSTHVGALLVSPNTGNILTWGVNTFTNKEQFTHPENFERPRKYLITEHAERAAIYSAARLGISTDGLILVCPWASCPFCANGIVLAGIKTVIGHWQAHLRTPEHWKEEIKEGMEILAGGGVEYLMFDGEIGGVDHLFNGEVWHP